MNHPAQEFEDRYAGEMRKAADKYGEIALLPGGHPDKDVIDYAINELVGLVRYAEMIQYRCRLLTTNDGGRINNAARAGIMTARELREQARMLGVELIDVRQRLKVAGLMLGEPEQREER